MDSIRLKNNRTIKNFGEPYFVAELNTSHFGSVDTAMEMIRQAKDIGVDCVKFQSWNTESLYSRSYYDENPIAKRFVKKFSFDETQLLELSRYCKKVGIGFASTPYSQKEVDFLVEQCDVPYIKIASMDIVSYPFLKFIASKNVPIVLATGMSDSKEIKKAVDLITNAGNNNICILHCISTYPVSSSRVNLNNIVGLRELLPGYPIGFSDHTLGCEMPVASIALGAALIEKHFTLDKSRIGMDNQMAMEPLEMKSMIEQCKNVYFGLGNKNRIVSIDEIEQRKNMRRSVVTAKDLPMGTIIKQSDLDIKRPGTGIPPQNIKLLIGKKTKRDILKDTLIFYDDFE